MWRFVVLALVLAATNGFAQSCAPPSGFFRTSAIAGSAALVAGNGGDCDVVASIAPVDSSAAGAFAWYTLPNPVPLWRISFRIDVSQLGALQFPDAVGFLSANTIAPYPEINGTTALMRLSLFTHIGSDEAALAVAYACENGTTAPNCIREVSDAITDGDLIRFELDVTEGSLRWWINADFDDTPTGGITGIDNAAWIGVQSVALGVFQPAGALASNGTQLRFSAIEADDIVFWDSFDQ